MSPRLRYLSTTLALVAVGLGYALIQGRFERPAPRIPARSEAARPAPLPPPPPAREVLDRGATLSLTADQKARLASLDRKWREESAPVEAALQEAEREFSQFMKDAHAGGRTSLQEIQHRSAEVRDLGAALRERRRLHSEAAADVLTGQQRRTLTSPSSPETTGGGR